ncbi:MAG: YjiH family protein [Halieaceae bacterium]|nr:YjiH family protein [Halieaceae bacterium]
MIFLTPVEVEGSTKVLLGVIVDWIIAESGAGMRWFCLIVFTGAAVLTPLFSYGPQAGVLQRVLPAAVPVLVPGPYATAARMIGGIVALLTFMGVGPDWMIDADTGGTAYYSLAAVIFCIIGAGALLMPLLTDYGLLEFFGTLLRRPFQAIFGLPGRATIDTLASWVGASSIAVLVTSRQYENGYYTAREASVIATNFSVVSVPFVFLSADIAGVGDASGTLYLAMVGIGVICALTTPRLWPLVVMRDDYYAPVGKQIHEQVASGSRLRWALTEGLKRAKTGPTPRAFIREGLATVLDLFIAMMPVAMTIEFVALVLYYHTGILHVLTAPLVPVLNLMALPDAAAAAPGIVIGFLDQFVPTVIASGIDAPETSFVLAGLSVTQLVFMAETGVLIYRSEIPLPIHYLATIFVIRTVIALPILAMIAHYVY